MTKVVDLGDEREKRKEPCLYCGQEQHATQLACPRITAIEIDPELATIIRIEFYKPVAGPDPA
jgi:hypothetical protein